MREKQTTVKNERCKSQRPESLFTPHPPTLTEKKNCQSTITKEASDTHARSCIHHFHLQHPQFFKTKTKTRIFFFASNTSPSSLISARKNRPNLYLSPSYLFPFFLAPTTWNPSFLPSPRPSPSLPRPPATEFQPPLPALAVDP